MAALTSFKDHLACLLAEHESVQRSLEDLRNEKCILQERLELLELAQSQTVLVSQTTGVGAQKLEPEEASATVPIASAKEAGASDGQFPTKLDGHRDVQPNEQQCSSSSSTWLSEGSTRSPWFPEQPPEVWPGYRNDVSTHSSVKTLLSDRRSLSSGRRSARSIGSGRSILSGEAVIDHKSRIQRLVIRPNSKRRGLWDCISVIMLGYDILYIPLEAFTLSGVLLEVGICMDVISTCFWTMDVLITFLTGYHTQGVVEMRPGRIARRYVHSFFWLDMMIICLDWALLAWHQLSSIARLSKTPRAMRLFRVMRATRLLRGADISRRIVMMFSQIRSDLLWTFWSLISILLMLLIFDHYIACGWFAIGMTSGSGWIQAAGIEACEPLYCYTTALHWSLSQHSPASMEVHAVNLQERIYSIFVLLVGMVFFSSFVSSITSAIMDLRRINTEQKQQEALLRRFFKDSKISAELGQRISQFLHDSHFRHRKRLHYQDMQILKLVPESMTNKLTEELYSPVLDQNPFFKRFGQVHLSVLHEVCHGCITERNLCRKEELFVERKAAENMSFVTKGSMDYHHRLAGLCNLVKAGQWACEPVLWMVWKHCGCLAAQTSCEIVQLHAQKFRAVSCREAHPHVYVSGYAQGVRAKMLSTAMWYTDIWSDMLETEGPVPPARLTQFQAIVGNTARWVPKPVRSTFGLAD